MLDLKASAKPMAEHFEAIVPEAAGDLISKHLICKLAQFILRSRPALRATRTPCYIWSAKGGEAAAGKRGDDPALALLAVLGSSPNER